jgi:hypothetical protein
MDRATVILFKAGGRGYFGRLPMTGFVGSSLVRDYLCRKAETSCGIIRLSLRRRNAATHFLFLMRRWAGSIGTARGGLGWLDRRMCSFLSGASRVLPMRRCAV